MKNLLVATFLVAVLGLLVAFTTPKKCVKDCCKTDKCKTECIKSNCCSKDKTCDISKHKDCKHKCCDDKAKSCHVDTKATTKKACCHEATAVKPASTPAK